MIFQFVERDKKTKVTEERGILLDLVEGDSVTLYDKNGTIGVLTMIKEQKESKTEIELILETTLDEEDY